MPYELKYQVWPCRRPLPPPKFSVCFRLWKCCIRQPASDVNTPHNGARSAVAIGRGGEPCPHAIP